MSVIAGDPHRIFIYPRRNMRESAGCAPARSTIIGEPEAAKAQAAHRLILSVWPKAPGKRNMLTNLSVSAELFHIADGTAFADLMMDGRRETWPVRSLRLRSWLRRQYYEATGAAPGAGAISSALNLLAARAQFDAPRRFRTKAEVRLDRLDAATSLRELAAIGGSRLEAFKGDSAGQYSIRINDQWRICFEWPPGSPGPLIVEITDYH